MANGVNSYLGKSTVVLVRILHNNILPKENSRLSVNLIVIRGERMSGVVFWWENNVGVLWPGGNAVIERQSDRKYS